MSRWPSTVEIGEVGPRDGLQNEATVPIADRVRLIDALSGTGLRRIEAVSFVSPKAIPHMAGAADVMVDFHDTLWDLAAARILVEEAGGVYRPVREFEVNGTRIYSAVFGKPSAVARACALLE